MKKQISILFLLFFAGQLYAGGFRVALQSARQIGMGHVGTGMKLGPESIFFNPGAVALSEKQGVSISGNGVFSNVQYNSPLSDYVAKQVENVSTPVAAYGSFNVTDRLVAGLGFYTPYGSRSEWPENWEGQYISQLIDLKVLYFQPTISYKVNDKLGIGAGLIYSTGNVELKRGIPIDTQAGETPDATLEAKASGYGFNAGISYTVDDDLTLGINYRSKVDVEAEDGTISFTNDRIPVSAAQAFTAKRFSASIPLPAELTFGSGLEVNDRLTIASDFNYYFWSAYKELKFKYDGLVGGKNESITPHLWEDSWAVRLGLQYVATDKLNLRGGAIYDSEVAPDATLSPVTPDQARYSFTGGFTFKPTDKLAIDGAIDYVNGIERTVYRQNNVAGFGQRYKSSAIIPSLGINYSFN